MARRTAPALAMPAALLALAAALAAGGARAGHCGSDCEPAPGIVSGVPDACATGGLQVTSWSLTLVINDSNCDLLVGKGEFQDQPEVIFPEAEPDGRYTLMILDPDAPNLRPGQSRLLWLVSNLKGSDFHEGYMDEATLVAKYEGPKPEEGSGPHRYQVLAFEQADAAGQLVTPPIPGPERAAFRLAEWLRPQRALCGPRAGAQFRAQH